MRKCSGSQWMMCKGDVKLHRASPIPWGDDKTLSPWLLGIAFSHMDAVLQTRSFPSLPVLRSLCSKMPLAIETSPECGSVLTWPHILPIYPPGLFPISLPLHFLWSNLRLYTFWSRDPSYVLFLCTVKPLAHQCSSSNNHNHNSSMMMMITTTTWRVWISKILQIPPGKNYFV